MIILFDGHSLNVRTRFQAESISLELSERQSSATLTLSPSAPVLSMDDWLQFESGPGKGIVWRVKTIEDQMEKRTRTVTVEHAIATLRDSVMFGEVTPQDISGSGAENASAWAAAAYVLGRQNNWRLGDVQYSDSAPYTFNGDDLFSAMETISSTLHDCIWEYDFRSYPFTLHIRRKDDSVRSEMRMDRNIRTLKKSIDRSRMYTRIYPIGRDNLHISGDYLSKNENLYGTVCKVEVDQGKETEGALRSWAQVRLDDHCEPAVTITISGVELAESTGEPLDSFVIGKICQVPLPEFSTTIVERVTKLKYPDVLSEPENVTVTLANDIVDVATIIRHEQATGSGGAGGRAAAKNAEEDHAWFVDTTEKVAMVAEAVGGKDASGNPNWSRVSELTVDGNGIDARVTYTEGETVKNTTRINQNEERIILEARRATSAETALSSRVTIEANRITQEVTRATTAEGTLSGRITTEENKISLVVKETSGGYEVNAASIVAGINAQGGSYVKLQADKIDLSGYVTASEFYAVDAKIDNLMSGVSTAGSMKADTFWCNSFSRGSYTYYEQPVRDIYNNIVYVLGRS